MRNEVKVVLRGKSPGENLEQHYKFISQVFKTHDALEKDDYHEVSFRNYLQSPLQPLQDNLESATYEVFEKDSIKYELYERGLYRAFMDFKNTGKFNQVPEVKPKELKVFKV